MLQWGSPALPVLADYGEGNFIADRCTTQAGAYEYRDSAMHDEGYDPKKADLSSLALPVLAMAIGVQTYEGMVRNLFPGSALLQQRRAEAFEKAENVSQSDGLNLLRRMTNDDTSCRPSYPEIFLNPWVQ